MLDQIQLINDQNNKTRFWLHARFSIKEFVLPFDPDEFMINVCN